MRFPAGNPPELPERFRGLPVIDRSRCPDDCSACIAACPTGALSRGAGERLGVDLGRCLFCVDCSEACPSGLVTFSRDPRLAVRERSDLFLSGAALRRAEALGRDLRRLLRRSLRLRQVSAGGCNACEADANVLSTVGWDMGRYGNQFVATPRHADGLLVTGPVTQNMREALLKTWDAVPDPKIVIASGACAISGGPYIGSPQASDGVTGLLKVDLFVPGCPPHPLTLLDGLLRLLGRLRDPSEGA
jgi:Ni,Fe-hydrogenase III small subunit/NAD-dependent dihydropyrimidine dehydrogenase PreA subunit